MKKVAVIGAGITGLSAAYELKKRKFEVSVFESSSRVGGVIQTDHEEDFLAEAGPQFDAGYPTGSTSLSARVGSHFRNRRGKSKNKETLYRTGRKTTCDFTFATRDTDEQHHLSRRENAGPAGTLCW